MLMHGREKYSHMENFRSGHAIIKVSQEALAATGSTDVIVPMRDIEGEVRTNVNFFTDPIRASEKTVLLTRNTAAQFELMNVLRARGYIHAKMLGNMASSATGKTCRTSGSPRRSRP